MKLRKLEKGEISILLAFTIVGIVVFALSLKMFQKDPTPSSQGAFPLLLGVLMLISSGFMLFDLRRFDSAYAAGEKALAKITDTLKFIFPNKILFAILLILLYSIGLTKIGFVASTFIYLFLSMVLLKSGQYMKILLISSGIVVSILVIFQYIFKVILP